MSEAATKITTPLALSRTSQCTITPPWFVQHQQPGFCPRKGSFMPLVNGEEAFDAVHQAIEQARKSVCIICWGFQPSMHFVRDGVSPSIGRLLETLAGRGIKVRILCFAFELTFGPDFVQRYVNVTGIKQGLDESNTPGRHDRRIEDRPVSSTDRQYEYDVRWYNLYDDNQEIEDVVRKKLQARFGDQRMENLHFRSRGFSKEDRARIAMMEHEDKGLSTETLGVLAFAPSHHQKMVLVDYEDASAATGFVMGHNMLDEYWDRCDHSYRRQPPNVGRNGMLPRQDLSSRITGPIVGDLFRNFAEAWKKETGETLPAPRFDDYKPRQDSCNLPVMAQILQTQPQTGVTDIKTCYLQAANNATSSIYIENQYFRWPPLAEKIKAAAKQQTAGGRDPAKHDVLYVFVVTNASESGMGKGAINTYRMLDSLGRADTIPEVTRLEKGDDIDRQIRINDKELESLNKEKSQLDETARLTMGYASADITRRYQSINERIAAVEARRNALKKQKAKLQDKKTAILPEERPGLKIHVCTLVAPDTPKGMEWVDVYVHAKLMIVNDTFMTLGSANINTRSMETDSELNIAHFEPRITRPLRQRLWGIHTGGIGAQDDPAEAFDSWREIIKKNKDLRFEKQPPLASLIEFYRGSSDRSNKD